MYIHIFVICKDYIFFPKLSCVLSENLPFLLTSTEKESLGLSGEKAGKGNKQEEESYSFKLTACGIKGPQANISQLV